MANKLNLIEDLGKGLKINNENWSGEKIEESNEVAPEKSDIAAKNASNKED